MTGIKKRILIISDPLFQKIYSSWRIHKFFHNVTTNPLIRNMLPTPPASLRPPLRGESICLFDRQDNWPYSDRQQDKWSFPQKWYRSQSFQVWYRNGRLQDDRDHAEYSNRGSRYCRHAHSRQTSPNGLQYCCIDPYWHCNCKSKRASTRYFCPEYLLLWF